MGGEDTERRVCGGGPGLSSRARPVGGEGPQAGFRARPEPGQVYPRRRSLPLGVEALSHFGQTCGQFQPSALRSVLSRLESGRDLPPCCSPRWHVQPGTVLEPLHVQGGQGHSGSGRGA